MTKKIIRKKRTQGSKWIRPEKRLAIYLRDDFKCVYCGRDLHHAANAEVTLDHVKCYSAGGSNESTNLITACRSCNSSRGAKKISEYADAHTKAAIRRQTRRSIKKTLVLAKSIISGACENNDLELK